MTLTRAEIELVVEELAPLVGTAVVQRVLEADSNTRILRLRVPGQTHLLLISLEDELTRVHFVPDKPAQPPRPTTFTMLLRKWLEGAYLEGAEMLNEDRILRADFDVGNPEFDGDGDPPRLTISLVAELFGRHPNLFLLDEDDVILGQQNRKVLGDRSLERGARYQIPPPPPPFSSGDKVRWSLDEIPADSGERSATLHEAYRDRGAQLQADRLERDLESRLDRQIKRLERRIEHVHDDLARAEDAETFKRRGELLQSAWGTVERGAESVGVPDFYEEGQPIVEVPLDPSRDLQENIEHYFHEYQRYSQATDRILERLETSESELEEVRAARSRFESIDDSARLSEFREELVDDGVLPRPESQETSSSRSRERKPYREFRAGSGARVLVGRGASDNDTLSTAVARGRDMWLHARDFAGAHVLLRMEKKQDAPRGEDLLDAATLAAWFSQGKSDTLVDVTYTRAKYVRKPKGFPPGRVTVADASTIAVQIEDNRLQRLLDGEQRS